MTISKLTDFQPLPEVVIGEIFSNLKIKELTVVKRASKAVNKLATAAIDTHRKNEKEGHVLRGKIGKLLLSKSNLDEAIGIAKTIKGCWLRGEVLGNIASLLMSIETDDCTDKAFEVVCQVPNYHLRERLNLEIISRLKSFGRLDKAAEVEKELRPDR